MFVLNIDASNDSNKKKRIRANINFDNIILSIKRFKLNKDINKISIIEVALILKTNLILYFDIFEHSNKRKRNRNNINLDISISSKRLKLNVNAYDASLLKIDIIVNIKFFRNNDFVCD